MGSGGDHVRVALLRRGSLRDLVSLAMTSSESPSVRVEALGAAESMIRFGAFFATVAVEKQRGEEELGRCTVGGAPAQSSNTNESSFLAACLDALLLQGRRLLPELQQECVWSLSFASDRGGFKMPPRRELLAGLRLAARLALFPGTRVQAQELLLAVGGGAECHEEAEEIPVTTDEECALLRSAAKLLHREKRLEEAADGFLDVGQRLGLGREQGRGDVLNAARCMLGAEQWSETIALCAMLLGALDGEARDFEATILYVRGRAHVGNGSRKSARADYKRAIKLRPNSRQLRSALKELTA